ncbi:MAG: hypothetical protein ACJ8J0_22040, partial [Longimicrobiaceae bacterium]
MVGGQLQQLGHAGERRLPVLRLLLEHFAGTSDAAPAEPAPPTLGLGSSGRPSDALCQANITWKSGVCARLRAGWTSSTTCSKGMSW